MTKKILFTIFAIVLFLWLMSQLGFIKVQSQNNEEPVRNITNCPYGDSATPDVCEKLSKDYPPEDSPVWDRWEK